MKKGGRRKVPCGRCVGCQEQKRAEWTFRIMQEYKESYSAFFITLTYDDKNLPANNSLNVRDIQLFLKKLRKEEKCLRYFLVGEYGTKFKRPHYHMILFNLRYQYRLLECWGKGYVHVGDVSQASVHYVTGYMVKDSNDRGSFALMSRKPGIGMTYLNDAYNYHKDTLANFATYPGGIKGSLPRYYKEKIFDEEEKEIIKNQIDEVINKKRDEADLAWMQSNGSYIHRAAYEAAIESARIQKKQKNQKL